MCRRRRCSHVAVHLFHNNKNFVFCLEHRLEFDYAGMIDCLENRYFAFERLDAGARFFREAIFCDDLQTPEDFDARKRVERKENCPLLRQLRAHFADECREIRCQIDLKILRFEKQPPFLPFCRFDKCLFLFLLLTRTEHFFARNLIELSELKRRLSVARIGAKRRRLERLRKRAIPSLPIAGRIGARQFCWRKRAAAAVA